MKLFEFRVGGLSELAQEFLCEKYPGSFSQRIDFKNVFLSHYELVLQVQPVSLLLVLCLALFLDHPVASLLLNCVDFSFLLNVHLLFNFVAETLELFRVVGVEGLVLDQAPKLDTLS